jgi:YfiH family protein
MVTDVGSRNDRLGPIRAERLDAAAEAIGHGFFTRRGGVSSGIYAGLNVGIGSHDLPENVRRNRALVTGHLGVGASMLACPHQVHSADAILVEEPFGTDRPRADAVVTAKPGLAIGVLTADCGPVLLADAEAGVIAAAHAGWKGALSGILENTVATMIRAGAGRNRIEAVLGPTISQDRYEVGPEFVDRFLAEDPASEDFFRPSGKPGHAMFDLPGFIVGRLRRSGVSVSRIPACTYADEASFYSYRRSTHRGESDYGRQISAIVLKGE